MTYVTALGPITGLIGHFVPSCHLPSATSLQQSRAEGAISAYVHVHRAGEILRCSITNQHQCPAITLSRVQHLDVEVRPLNQLTFGLLLGSLGCFFLKYIL